MKKLQFYIACSFTILASLSSGLEVQLTVSEPIGAARQSETVWGGIPFPAGKYNDVSQFSLWLEEKEVPVQVSPIVLYRTTLYIGVLSVFLYRLKQTVPKNLFSGTNHVQ